MQDDKLAADGREAVEAVRKERPALILMDLTMPVLDGFEATRLIRRIKGAAAASSWRSPRSAAARAARARSPRGVTTTSESISA